MKKEDVTQRHHKPQQESNTQPSFEGEFYHVYNRGANQAIIFHNDKDHLRFQRLMFLSNSTKGFVYRDYQNKNLGEIEREENLVGIVAYTLMPNHFHILLEEKIPGGKEMFLRKLCTGYSMYYNKVHKHSGTLFQGRSKSKLILDDIYFQYLFVYIHMNPVKIIEPSWKAKPTFDTKKVDAFLRTYQYSSYVDYLGEKREESAILEKDASEILKTHVHNDPKDVIADWLQVRNFTEVRPQ